MNPSGVELDADDREAQSANWKDGDDVIISGSVSDEEAKALFPNSWKTVKPYLRVVAQPR